MDKILTDFDRFGNRLRQGMLIGVCACVCVYGIWMYVRAVLCVIHVYAVNARDSIENSHGLSVDLTVTCGSTHDVLLIKNRFA